MEKYTVIITPQHREVFEVGAYPHHDSGSCKYRIFQDGLFVASLEPDGDGFLHVCQNPAGIDLELLHLLAEQIERRHPGPKYFADLENIEFDRDDQLEAPPQV